MKKALIILLLLLLCTTFIFVACDNNESSATPPIEEEIPPIKGDKWGSAVWKPLNKYEWEELFSTTKFVNAKIETTYADGTDEIIIDGFKVYYNLRGVEYYEHYHNGKITTYNLINQEWYATTIANSLNSRTQYDSVNTLLAIYKENYSNLVYKDGYYRADKLLGFNDMYIKIKVRVNEENKIAEFETSTTQNISNYVINGKISYGKNQINLPVAKPIL